MHAPGDDRFFTELRGCTAELARVIDGDLERPVPTCPGWTFRQLATHLGRGHRWAAQIVATRATTPIPMREVADGKLPQDPAQHAIWLNAGAGRVIEAVTAAGSDLVWTLAGIGPAPFCAMLLADMGAEVIRLDRAANVGHDDSRVGGPPGEEYRFNLLARGRRNIAVNLKNKAGAEAALRLATGDPQAAADALAPILDGSLSGVRRVRMVTALLLEARARDALGDQAASGRVLERALDITESNGILLPFLLDPAPALLERHRRYGTANSSAHPALIAQILDLLRRPAKAVPPPGGQAGWDRGPGLDEQLTDSETRVLRYLPTHLTAPEIAAELWLSVNTVSTHTRHLYAKLGVHNRHEAVDRARALGLLAPSARRA